MAAGVVEAIDAAVDYGGCEMPGLLKDIKSKLPLDKGTLLVL